MICVLFILMFTSIRDTAHVTYTYTAPVVEYCENKWSKLDTLTAIPINDTEDFIEYYDVIFRYVAEKTGLSEAFIYAYFVIETADRHGKRANSELWRYHNNPGGIKWKSFLSDKIVKYEDDCFDENGNEIDCKFASFNTIKEGIDAWLLVFNANRYDRCKNLPLKETCKCFRDRKYHSSPRYLHRYLLAEEYNSLVIR